MSNITRKEFAAVAALAVVGAAGASRAVSKEESAMKEIALAPLPYAESALEPVVSARTVSFHYGKHHAGYVATLNKLVAGTPYAGLPLEEVVRKSAADGAAAVFNNAAQAWNHAFYWRSLAPEGTGGAPSGAFAEAVQRDFGSAEALCKALAEAAVKRFGSGWAWLVARGGRLEVVSTANAETPLTDRSATPLLTLDVWEHAYYLDWQNRRADYAAAVLSKLVNWKAASEAFERAGA